MKVDSDQSKASLVHSELYVGRTDGMVIKGHRSSKSTFGANKLMFHMYTWEDDKVSFVVSQVHTGGELWPSVSPLLGGCWPGQGEV